MIKKNIISDNDGMIFEKPYGYIALVLFIATTNDELPYKMYMQA